MYPTEEHRFTSAATALPVESGASLVDNVVVQPTHLKLTGVVATLLPAENNRVHPDRASEAWQKIRDLQLSRTPLTVLTTFAVYSDMIIVRATANVDYRSGRSLRFELDLQEILRGETIQVRIGRGTATGPATDRLSLIDGGDRTSDPVVFPSQFGDFLL